MSSSRIPTWSRRTVALALFAATAQAAPTELARHSGAHVQRPQLAPDGLRVAYEANDHDQMRIVSWVGDVATRSFSPVHGVGQGSGLTSGFSTQQAGPRVVHELSWSPASIGQYIYASSANGRDFDLFFAGGRAAVVGPTPDGGPTWSPDGQSIAFTSARTGEGDLYLSSLTRLLDPPQRLTSRDGSSEVYAAWGPQSDRIAYVAHSDAGDNLYWVVLGQPGEVQLTRWSGTQTRPRFSPDGEHIAFYANHEDPDRFDLYVLEPLHLAEPRLILRDVVMNEEGPVWSPDGQHLLAVLDDDARYDPLVSVRWTNPREVSTIATGTVGHGDFDLRALPSGGLRLVWAAQGPAGATDLDFRRLYSMDLPRL